MGIFIAVDIGGTFTDVIGANADDGRFVTVKVPTRRARPVESVFEGASHVLKELNERPSRVERFIHGTTVATNAVLERRGARVLLLTTEGFEDVLEIGRLKRSAMYDLNIDAQTPTFLASRRWRQGIRERVDADGNAIVPLDETRLRTLLRGIKGEECPESIAICLLFAFRNPAHEQRVREIAEEEVPGIPVSVSSEIDPMLREYERTVVTCFDAYVGPGVSGYIQELEAGLEELEITAPLQIMQSRGGLASAALARPVSLLMSGPAAGVIGAQVIANQSGFESLITIDVGGTSADVSLVEAGKPMVSTEGSIDGLPLRVPMVDVNTVGAGGGSIAWIDGGGNFRVGPRSAGADPGPACYARGGHEATVTDASLALGYLNPAFFAGGAMSIDSEAADTALRRLGDLLGMTAIEAAAGMHRIINSKMADAIRLVSVRKGHDPRRFALVLLGGAGPVHGGRLAQALGIDTLIVPRFPGVLSALGLLVAKVEHEQAEMIGVRAEQVMPDVLQATFGKLEQRVATQMAREHELSADIQTRRLIEMRYIGQGYTLDVETRDPIDAGAMTDAVEAFRSAHERVYGYRSDSAAIELANIRVVQSSSMNGPHLAFANGARNGSQEATAHREAYFQELGGYVVTPVFRRDALGANWKVTGPAIVEQSDTTLIVYPGQSARVDDIGNIIVRASEGEVTE